MTITRGSTPHHARTLALFGVTILCLGYAFWLPLGNLVNAWNSPEYGHSILLPFLALLMTLHRFEKHPPMPKPSWLGLVCVLGGVGLLTLGVLSAFRQLAHYGVILSLLGLCLAYLGRQATGLAAPAFFYLLLAIPLPMQMQNGLSLDMQLFSSKLGVALLEILGVPAYQDGNVIDLGTYKLEVAAACSGLRYLFPLMSFAFLAAYLLRDRWWKKIVVFLSTIPITIALNSLRIAFIGVTVNWWGAGMAEGVIHDFEGWVVFLFCVMLLLGEIAILIRIGPHVGSRGSFDWNFFSLPTGRILKGPIYGGAVAMAVMIISLIAATTIGTGAVGNRMQTIPEHQSLSHFPLTIGSWHAQPQTIDSDVLSHLALTDYWLADYVTDPQTPPVDLYIAYYDTQKLGAVIHSPSTCIPGGGWHIDSIEQKTLTLPSLQMSLPVARLVISRGPMRQILYYWYNQRGRNISGQLAAKYYLLIDSVLYNRSDGSLIRVSTSVAKTESDQDAEKRLDDFINLAFPAIEASLPKGIEE